MKPFERCILCGRLIWPWQKRKTLETFKKWVRLDGNERSGTSTEIEIKLYAHTDDNLPCAYARTGAV